MVKNTLRVVCAESYKSLIYSIFGHSRLLGTFPTGLFSGGPLELCRPSSCDGLWIWGEPIRFVKNCSESKSILSFESQVIHSDLSSRNGRFESNQFDHIDFWPAIVFCRSCSLLQRFVTRSSLQWRAGWRREPQRKKFEFYLLQCSWNVYVAA